MSVLVSRSALQDEGLLALETRAASRLVFYHWTSSLVGPIAAVFAPL